MKQKKIGNKLYVFDLEAYQITADTDAEVVYVQNHVYDAFKALNPSLNIKRYNYKVMATNKPEWYDYIAQADDNSGNGGQPFEPVDPNQTPVTWTTPSLSFSPSGGTVPINGDPSNVSIPIGTMLSNPDNVQVTFSITQGSEYAYLDAENNLHPNQSLENTVGNYYVEVTVSYVGDPANYKNPNSAITSWTFIISESGNSEAPVQKQEAGIYFYSPTSSIPHTYNPSNQTSTTFNVQSTLANPNAVGPINYAITSGSEYATLDEMNQLVVNNSLTAGQYPVVVEASFAGNSIYNSATVTLTITINVENYVEPAFTPVTYSFESFDSNNHNIKYGTGKVVTIENQVIPGYVGVQVTENTFDVNVETPFVGRIFYIDGNAQPADGIYWNLYEYSNSMLAHTEVDVKVYNENMIPSEATPSE